MPAALPMQKLLTCPRVRAILSFKHHSRCRCHLLLPKEDSAVFRHMRHAGRVVFTHIAESEEFARFVATMYQLVGIRVALYDHEQHRIRETQYPGAPLCALIRSTHTGLARCRSTDGEHLASAVKTHHGPHLRRGSQTTPAIGTDVPEEWEHLPRECISASIHDA